MYDYIVTGNTDDSNGVGRVINYLTLKYPHIKLINPQKIKVLRCLLYNTKLKHNIFLKLVYRIERLLFIAKIHFVWNKKLTLIHPQSIGYKNSTILINRNRVSIYVMDNSFFCLKSYNNIYPRLNPCLECIGKKISSSLNNNCYTYPVRHELSDFEEFITTIQKNINKIKFLCQTEGQMLLLKKQFGDKINFRIIGLMARDFFNNTITDSIIKEMQFDIVFHANDLYSKGLYYSLELAARLSEFSFLFPFENKFSCSLSNTKFHPLNWESGLNSAVSNAKIILCPSIWSAPIEGSIVKSLLLGMKVAVFDFEYSFPSEIPDSIKLKLTGEINKDCELIRNYMKHEVQNSDKEIAISYMKNKLDNFSKQIDLEFCK